MGAFKKNKIKIPFKESVTKKKVFDEDCILHRSFSLIADKWTLLIIMSLLQGTKRNSEIQRQVQGITPKMLAQTLKTLLKYGMVERKVFPEVPPRVEYTLTEFGRSLSEPLSLLFDWSLDWEDKLNKIYSKKKRRK
ncbi:winged helix-turn-helix transcriptional regulator [Zobellia laminariae]|uniref:winged helix-turn-helix transcriptional regulator n=1 Tax=Zobellia laminariae TaxID=248906 RepID=UPI0026F40ED5|nr:helix-turn-helix domain-containing protein [Zobellia laminariae]WKX75871.1 helix-turn-helix domain-containing protein [Zobellia laminariae]